MIGQFPRGTLENRRLMGSMLSPSISVNLCLNICDELIPKRRSDLATGRRTHRQTELLEEKINCQAGVKMRCTQGQRDGATVSCKPKIKRGLWSPEEDEKLINYMKNKCHIGCTWSYVSKHAGNKWSTQFHFNFSYTLLYFRVLTMLIVLI